MNHPLQSYEWGEFRQKTGVKVIRSRLAGQFTIHKIPCLPAGKAYLPFTIGYLPKGSMPTKKMIDELRKIGGQENCIFVQLEPNVIRNQESGIRNREEVKKFESIIHDSQFMIRLSAHPLFTKYTFQLDLTKSEEELLKAMHQKTRYNIKVAQKRGVKVVEDNSDQAFKTYLELSRETTKRQGFYAHDERYHRLMWQTLKTQNSKLKTQNYNKLTAHLLIANYSPQPTPTSRPTSHRSRPIPLVAWLLFVFNDTLYYPYGASSDKYREVMASNLMMWEAIRFGKKLGLKTFDLWGSLGPNPDKNDPWYGFHRFKEGYGGKLVEFVGSYDLVIKPFWYQLYILADKLRWLYLRLKSL